MVLLNILLVVYQAMKACDTAWLMISELTQEQCLQRLTANSQFAEGLPAALKDQAVHDTVKEHPELWLLAFVRDQLRQHNLLAINTDAEKYLVLAALNLVDCVAACSSNGRLHPVIWLACSSKCLASSAGVLSSRKAARATWALNAGVCVRWMRRADFFLIENSFSPDRPRPGFMPGVSTYSVVQICGATSP